MTPTLAEARAEVYALLDVDLPGIGAVYDHEPTGEVTGPVYVTVTFGGMRSTAILETVRVYSQMLDSPQVAAERLEEAIAVVDDALKAEQLGPSEWAEAAVDAEVGCLVSRCFVEIMRETY